MADPATYRPAPGSIPESPGVYRFRDKHGRVVYVGKAKNLRSRLNSYFSDFASLHPRTQWMLLDAAGVEWTVVGTEVDSVVVSDVDGMTTGLGVDVVVSAREGVRTGVAALRRVASGLGRPMRPRRSARLPERCSSPVVTPKLTAWSEMAWHSILERSRCRKF